MIKHIRIVALAWLIFATITTVEAQEREGVLSDLWGKIEENYPGVTSKESKVSAAKLNEQAVKGCRLP